MAILTGMATALIALAIFHLHGHVGETVMLAGPHHISLAAQGAQTLMSRYAWKEEPKVQSLLAASITPKNLPCMNYSEGLEALSEATFGCSAHSAITSFNFQNCTDPNRTEIRASYTCLGLGDKIILTATPSYSTACYPAGHIDSWASHDVQCPAGQVLRSFKLTGCGAGKVKTDYWCSDAVMGPASEAYSPCFAAEGMSLDFLDNQGGGCLGTTNGAMTGFQLQSHGCAEGQMHFKYSCARIGMPGECRDGSHCDLYNIGTCQLHPTCYRRLRCS